MYQSRPSNLELRQRPSAAATASSQKRPFSKNESNGGANAMRSTLAAAIGLTSLGTTGETSCVRGDSLPLPSKRQKVDKTKPSNPHPTCTVAADACCNPLKNFPETLYDILEKDAYQDIISWLPDGDGFSIHDKKRFVSQILPCYLEGAKFSSFMRRLRRWKFDREPPYTYRNKYFLRDRPDLVSRMAYGVDADGEQLVMEGGSERSNAEMKLNSEKKQAEVAEQRLPKESDDRQEQKEQGLILIPSERGRSATETRTDPLINVINPSTGIQVQHQEKEAQRKICYEVVEQRQDVQRQELPKDIVNDFHQDCKEQELLQRLRELKRLKEGRNLPFTFSNARTSALKNRYIGIVDDGRCFGQRVGTELSRRNVFQATPLAHEDYSDTRNPSTTSNHPASSRRSAIGLMQDLQMSRHYIRSKNKEIARKIVASSRIHEKSMMLEAKALMHTQQPDTETYVKHLQRAQLLQHPLDRGAMALPPGTRFDLPTSTMMHQKMIEEMQAERAVHRADLVNFLSLAGRNSNPFNAV
mmetsp:Transcript_33530/g.70507  ORF Transcript_33530/g.70507 Transcript_33530/m.70507 type:complete len:528 (+) Transcript_33530:285-1868(+)